MWLSKKQATIETVGIDTIRVGFAISGPTYIYGDNMSLINNTQRPESTLKKKKSNAICYHAVRESVDMGILDWAY